MKTASIVLCCLVIAVSSSYAASLNRVKRQVVPKEFANINIENYLKNDRAVAFQLKCIVYDGPCDRIGKYLKITIPELLTNQCQSCDPAQRQRAGRLVQHIQQKFPKEWSDAIQKFQGGQVKKEDADKLETLLGVKLDSKLVAEAPTTVAPVAELSSTEATTTTTTTVAPVSSSVAPAATSTAPASSSVAPVTSTAVPVSSSTAPEVISTSTAAPAASSSEVPAVVSSSVAPVVSSVAPETQSSTVVAEVVTSSTAAPVTSETPVSTSSTLAPAPVPVVPNASVSSPVAVVAQ